MSEDEIQRVRRIYDAFSRDDAEEVVRSVSHDIEWTITESLPWGGDRHGPEGVRALLASFRDHVEGAWADPDDFFDTDEYVIVLGRLRGRGRATGRGFEVPFAHVWMLADGMPSRCRTYFDSAPITAAIEAGD